jgi:hypothetical protein
MGGGHLVDVACPRCTGLATPEVAAKQSWWGAGCETCGWYFDDEDEPLLNASDARLVALDHQCEPEPWIRHPDGREFSPDDFDHDGKLRKPLVGA